MKKQSKIQLLDIVPIFILAGIFIIFTVASNGATLSSYNLKLLCTNVVPVIIGSLGCIFVIALGGTDISIGASVYSFGLSTVGGSGSSWKMRSAT